MTATPQAAARILGFGAIVIVAVALAVVLFGGEEDRYEVTAEFRNASQLVGGELVVVDGVRRHRRADEDSIRA